MEKSSEYQNKIDALVKKGKEIEDKMFNAHDKDDKKAYIKYRNELHANSIAKHELHLAESKKELAEAKKKKLSKNTIWKLEGQVEYHQEQIKKIKENNKEFNDIHKNESLSSQIKKLAEDLNANGELTSDVEIVIEPEVGDDALNYCDSCDKKSEECICDNEDDCDCDVSELDEDAQSKIDSLSKEIENLANKSDRLDDEARKEKDKNGLSKKYYEIRVSSVSTMVDVAKKKAERYKLKGGDSKKFDSAIKGYESEIKDLKKSISSASK